MPIVTATSVSKRFKTSSGTITALDNISLSVQQGEIFALLGPNGAGKTTLLNILLGLLEQDEGDIVLFDGTPDALEHIAYVSGEANFHWALYCTDVLRIYAGLRGLSKEKAKERIAYAIKLFGLSSFLKQRIDTLSTGQRVRLVLAVSLLHEPKLLLLDEPTLGLDPDIAQDIRNEIKRLNRAGTTIILTTHYMHEVEELANRAAFIMKGKICDVGGVQDLLKRQFPHKVLRLTFPSIGGKEASFLRSKGFRISGNVASKSVEATTKLSHLESLWKGLTPDNVEFGRPDMEDYFVQMMRGKR